MHIHAKPFYLHNPWKPLKSIDAEIVQCGSLLKISIEADSTEPSKILLRSNPLSKSFAQVAASVAHSVRQKPSGLKPDPSKLGKSRTHGVRFQFGELAIIATKAQLAGVSVNSYIRASALGSDYKQPINPELQNLLQATHRQLTGLANNYNQIAKYLHMAEITPNQAVGMVDSIRVPLVRALMAIKDALAPDSALT